jgi:hypothetical protein
MSADPTFRFMCLDIYHAAERVALDPAFKAGYRAWRKNIDENFGGDWKKWWETERAARLAKNRAGQAQGKGVKPC